MAKNNLKVTRKLKKKVVRKVSGKKVVRRDGSVKKLSTKLMRKAPRNKMRVAVGRLILFTVLTFISFVLLGISNDELYVNLFILLTTLCGVITFALILSILVLYLKRNLGK